MRIQILLLFIIIPITIFSKINPTYPANIEAVLKLAGKNRKELEKSISFFQHSNNPLKLKAIYFLISNMDIHYSSDYYWVDAKGRKVSYNELDYPDFGRAVTAFEEIRKRTPGIHPVPVVYPDIANIKADFLIENIESAFKSWKNGPAKNISFTDFCEYILPYRASVEPLQNWRQVYQKKFSWISEMIKKKDLNQTLIYTATDERNWFMDTWGKEVRSEPLPRLGALQLLFRKKGPCEDIADLEIFTLRSQGIPIALDIIPHWATSTDGHYLNTVFDGKMQPINYDVMKTPPLGNSLGREPSKVIRLTYSKQPNVLADIVDSTKIPNCFMRSKNYLDVTSQYWKTTTVQSQLSHIANQPKIAYVCVFNGLRWTAAWWGRIKNNNVNFNNMCKGVVFLPAYYIKGKLIPAGYPIAKGYNHEVVLKPDLDHKGSIVISEEEKYLLFQPSKKYRLFYWDNKWKLIGIKTPTPFSKIMLFDNVPQNALLILIPEYTQGKERPFMMTTDDKRIWW